MGYKDNKDLKMTKGGLPIPDWDEFKGETGVAVKILEVAKIIPAHFVMTAHPVSRAQTTKQGASTNETLASMIKATTLATYGWKTPSLLPCYVREMYYFYTDATPQVGQDVKRYVQTVSAGEIIAKSALGLPNRFEITNRPLWQELEALIKERKTKIEQIRKELEQSKTLSPAAGQ
jgi:hypothetical protein